MSRETLPKEIVVRSPLGTDCDLLTPKRESVGLLLTRAPDGVLVGTACSIVAPGALVVVGGEPRGGVIKVVVGLLILGLVLLWSRRRTATRHAAEPSRRTDAIGARRRGSSRRLVSVAESVRFPRVLVVGAGQMGAGIAQVVAASGRHVFLHDVGPGGRRPRIRGDAEEPCEARREGWGGSGRGARTSDARWTTWFRRIS